MNSTMKLCFSNLSFDDGRPIVRFRRRGRGKPDGWVVGCLIDLEGWTPLRDVI